MRVMIWGDSKLLHIVFSLEMMIKLLFITAVICWLGKVFYQLPIKLPNNLIKPAVMLAIRNMDIVQFYYHTQN